MQLLARLMDHVLAERGQRATIVGATSGDTGGAAIEAFAGRDAQRHLHPLPARSRLARPAAADDDLHRGQRPRDCHRRQFRRLPAPREGHVQPPRLPRPGRPVGGELDQLGPHHGPDRLLLLLRLSLGAPDRPVSFVVPTGNFGDIFAGHAARMMGLPIERLVIATNENDILARALESGRYETRGVVATTSPSMDIQVSSNFERLLFEATAAMRRACASGWKDCPSPAPSPSTTKRLRPSAEFDAGRADRQDTADTIATVLARSGYLLDPHTATAMHVARQRPIGRDRDSRAGHRASGQVPRGGPGGLRHRAGMLPEWLGDLMEREERFTTLPSDQKMLEDHIGRLVSKASRERIGSSQ
jgi:threonine synthase